MNFIDYNTVNQIPKENLDKVLFQQELQWHKQNNDQASIEKLLKQNPSFNINTSSTRNSSFIESAKLSKDCYNNINKAIDEQKMYIQIEGIANPLRNIKDPKNIIFYRNLSIIKIMQYCKNNGLWNDLLNWSKYILPEYLSTDQFKTKGSNGKNITIASDNEKWHLYVCKALSKLNEFDKCKTIAEKALNYNKDSLQKIWFNYYLIKSNANIAINCKNVNDIKNSIDDFNIFLLRNKKEWFVYDEISSLYYALKDYKQAYYYLIKAINSDLNHKIEYKWELFYKASLISKLLNDHNTAKEYALLSYSLRNEHEWKIPQTLNDLITSLNINTDKAKSKNIINKLQEHWNKVVNEDLKIYTGIISKYLPNERSGFIVCDTSDIGNIYFTLRSLNGDKNDFPENIKVEFNVEEHWNNTRNEATTIASKVKVIQEQSTIAA